MGPEDFIPEICKIKHNTIDKDMNNIKEDIEEHGYAKTKINKEHHSLVK